VNGEIRGRGFLSFSTWTLVGPSENVKRSRARTSCGSRPREHFTFSSDRKISLPSSILVAHTERRRRLHPETFGREGELESWLRRRSVVAGSSPRPSGEEALESSLRRRSVKSSFPSQTSGQGERLFESFVAARVPNRERLSSVGRCSRQGRQCRAERPARSSRRLKFSSETPLAFRERRRGSSSEVQARPPPSRLPVHPVPL